MHVLKRLFLALAFVAMAKAALAQPVSTLPNASTPLSGSEIIYLIQGGVSSKTTTGNLTVTSSLAQFASPPPIGVTAPNTGAFTTLSAIGAINTTSASGYQQNGASILNQSGSNAFTLSVGAGACSSITTSVLSTCVGYDAGQSITTGNELTALGAYAAQYVTTATFITAIGQHALGYETAGNGSTAVGSDSQRDSVSYQGNGGNTSVGKNSIGDGSGQYNTALGWLAMAANSALVNVGGTATNGDTLNITWTGSFPGSPVTVGPIPVTTGETTTQMATAIATATNASSLFAAGVIAGHSGPTANFTFPGSTTSGWTVTFSTAVTGAGTETLATTTGFQGAYNIAVGSGAMQGDFSLTSANYNIAIGQNAFQFITSGSNDIGMGQYTGIALSSGIQDILIGGSSGAAMTTASYNDCIGDLACQSIVSGGFQTALGTFAMANNTTNDGGNPNGNVAVGAFALYGAVGSANFYGNTGVGGYSGYSLTTGSANTLLGSQAGKVVTSGNNQTIIGYEVGSQTDATGTHVLLIGTGNSCDTPASSTNAYIGICAGSTPIISATGTTAPLTAQITFSGEIIAGGGSVQTTATTTGFLHLPFVAAAPTGIPANIKGNACIINTATESLNCYIGSSWYHVAMTSGAN